MGKHSKGRKRENLGKGKVTPFQIAFIVGRYLEDNHYTNTLSSFKSEAVDLFSRTKGKEVPKGLMGLGDILDEYISLKEQRLMVDHEKRRVETALKGFQDVMRAYYSVGVGNIPLPSSTPLLPPCASVAASMAPLYTPPINTCNASPSGHIINASPMLNHEQQSVFQQKAAENRSSSTHAPKSSSANKRKATRSFQKHPSAPKRSCVQSLKDSFNEQGNTLSSENACAKSTIGDTEKPLAAESTSGDNLKLASTVQESAVARTSILKHPCDHEGSSGSPKTPGQKFATQANKFRSPLDGSPVRIINTTESNGVASSKCSVISSKTVIVSPLKDNGYFAVERSYHVTTSSPLHSNTKEPIRREHIRGRLDFDDSDLPASSEKPLDTDSSTSSTDGETQEFDFDLPDLDILGRDFSFSQLLVDFDIDCEKIPGGESTTTDLLPGAMHNVFSGCMETNQTSVAPCESSLTALSPEDSNMQASDSVAALRSVTRCIIVSPAKTRGNSTTSPVVSPEKRR